MGYTHYWRSTAFIPTDEQIAKAMQDLRIIVDACAQGVPPVPVPVSPQQRPFLASWDGEPGTKPEIDVRAVSFNGVGAEAHETFLVRFQADNTLDNNCINCKTERKPYDIVVVACLCALADRLGPAIKITSDGDRSEWNEGRKLAERLLGRFIKSPDGVRLAD